MKIREIDIKNFRGYGENISEKDGFFKFRDLDKPDIVLITGHNGYGKTSLYEAIEWCLTDDIKALRKHTESVNYKNTLKKSHYLKFQGVYDNKEQKNMREVQVRIIFDNGCSLMRRTTCNSLHEDEYVSYVLNELGKAMNAEEAKNEIEKFIIEITGQTVENFFRLSFCGQAYSRDLIYDTGAKERGGIWISFLGMSDIANVINNSNGRSNPMLAKKKSAVEDAIEEGNKSKEKVDVLFQTNNWGSIQEYQRLVSNEIKQINNFQKEWEKIGIGQGFPLKQNSITDIVETLNKTKLLKERVDKYSKSSLIPAFIAFSIFFNDITNFSHILIQYLFSHLPINISSDFMSLLYIIILLLPLAISFSIILNNLSLAFSPSAKNVVPLHTGHCSIFSL